MKNKFLRVFAFFCVLAIMLCISGCYNPNMIFEEAREMHAYYTDDSFEKIRFNGDTFVRYEKDIPFDIFVEGYAYLTKKGVPATMAQVEGSTAVYNKNKTLIYIESWKDGNYAFFVKSGFEAELETIIQSGVHEFYCTNDPFGDGNYEIVKGDKKEAIEKTLASAPLTDTEIPQNLYQASGYLKVDKDFTLMSKDGFVVYESNGEFYFDAGYGWYKVPSEYSGLFVDEYEKNYFDYNDFENSYGDYDSI